MIYLAAPYSHPDPIVVNTRMEEFYRKQVELINKGSLVVSALDKVYMANFYRMNTTWKFWKKYSTELISRCDIVYVLMLPGWTDSDGVQGEIEVAKKLNKPIVYLNV